MDGVHNTYMDGALRTYLALSVKMDGGKDGEKGDGRMRWLLAGWNNCWDREKDREKDESLTRRIARIAGWDGERNKHPAALPYRTTLMSLGWVVSCGARARLRGYVPSSRILVCPCPESIKKQKLNKKQVFINTLAKKNSRGRPLMLWYGSQILYYTCPPLPPTPYY